MRWAPLTPSYRSGLQVSTITCPCSPTESNTCPILASRSGSVKPSASSTTTGTVSALVTKEDTVPVVVDDALGFTDPDRLARMGQVFDSVGEHGQVIVLTCSPERYDGVKGAHRIDLNV